MCRPFKKCKGSGSMATAIWALSLTLMMSACGRQDTEAPSSHRGPSKLIEIQSTDHFNTVTAATEDQLIIFDFFADWCYPCKQLEPILEKIARDPDNPIPVYKVDFDAHQSLARMLEVRGLPFVAFVKNRTVVYTLMGLHPEDTYLEAIDSFTPGGRRS